MLLLLLLPRPPSLLLLLLLLLLLFYKVALMDVFVGRAASNEQARGSRDVGSGVHLQRIARRARLPERLPRLQLDRVLRSGVQKVLPVLLERR